MMKTFTNSQRDFCLKITFTEYQIERKETKNLLLSFLKATGSRYEQYCSEINAVMKNNLSSIDVSVDKNKTFMQIVFYGEKNGSIFGRAYHMASDIDAFLDCYNKVLKTEKAQTKRGGRKNKSSK